MALAGGRQLRLAPAGGVVGFDLTALFALGEGLGVSAGALAEFLPAIEAGMIAAHIRLREADADD